MSRTIERAQMLMQTNRWAEAKKELSLGLADSPDDPRTHTLLGMCCSMLDEHATAIEHGQLAASQVPDDGQLLANLAFIYSRADRYGDAQACAQRALAIDPGNSLAHYVNGTVCVYRKDWQGAKEAAEAALAYDPEDTDARNLRALALRSLGEAGASVEELKASLRINAHDAHSHANLGWTYLQQGDLKQAETHFREALRLDPNLEWARIGALETLKAKVPVYRWILGYFMWMATKTAGMQWMIILGLFVGMRILRTVGETNPALQMVVFPLMVLYILFCVTTWFAGPISNAFLVLHPFGRMAMTPWERIGGISVGLAILATLLTAGLGFGLDHGLFLLLALCLGVTAIPLALMFQAREGKPRHIMAAVTAGAAASALIFAFTSVFDVETMPAIVAQVATPIRQFFPFIPLGALILSNVLHSR